MILTQLRTKGPKILITTVQNLVTRDSCTVHYNVRESGGKTPYILNLDRPLLTDTHPRYLGYSEASWTVAVAVIIQERIGALNGEKEYKRMRTHNEQIKCPFPLSTSAN